MWGDRVVIPQAGRERVLKILHDGHPGILRMKRIARGVVWWPKIDTAIEKTVQDCQACQLHQKTPATTPLHPWEWPTRPWSRIHIDHAGPFMGKIFFVLVDAHSKWMDAHIVSSTSSGNVISVLRSVFATHGLPETVVSDNGTAFTSAEFRTFLKRNGIRQITSAPYHPATNGLAERAVQTLKNALRKANSKDIEATLARFLFHYRTTPHSTTGLTPAEMLMGRTLRTHLDLIKPDIAAKVKRAQDVQKQNHDRRSKPLRSFAEDDPVFVRNFGDGEKWLPGTVELCQGPVNYRIKLQDGKIVRRHITQIRKRSVEIQEALEAPDLDLPQLPSTDTPNPNVDTPDPEPTSEQDQSPTETQPLRRSTRIRHPPERYGEQVSFS